MQPHQMDLNGRHNIMVTAMLGDSVVKVSQLTNQAKAKGTVLCRVLQATGAGIFLVGVVYAALGQVGLASMLLLVGLGQVVYASTRLRHGRRARGFSLGSGRGADLPLAHAALGAGQFPLVRPVGQGHELVFSTAMEGQLEQCGQRTRLADLPQLGLAHPDRQHPGAFSVPLARGARAELRLGDSSFLVRAEDPASEVNASLLAGVDWNAQVFNGGSFAAHAVVLFLVFLVPPNLKHLGLDAFNTMHKLVDYRSTAKDLSQEEVPPWLKKKNEQQDEGRAGQAAKGKMGEIGTKKAKKKGRLAIKGPKDNKTPQMPKSLAINAARQAGVLVLLSKNRTGAFGHLFGKDSALGDEAVNAMGKLQGDDIGDAPGIGGLGPVGNGRGGGGTAEGGVGYGPLGTIGGGTRLDGRARYGSGFRLRDHKVRHVVPVKPLTATVLRGSLSKSIIRRIVRRHLNEVRFCYQKELQVKRDLYGRLVVNFTIAGNGQVITSGVSRSTLRNVNVETCISRAVRRWLFPKPQGGGLVVVSYPFVLRSPHAK